jgi:hypothetical protein
MSESMSANKAKREAKQRDDYTCQFCGMTEEEHKSEYGRGIEAHHIIKQRKGGKDHPDNLITVCQECHKTLEKTQANAISQIQENILSIVEERYVESRCIDDIVRDAVKDVQNDNVGMLVEKGKSYYHSDEGVVSVRGFETEVVSADTDGVNRSIVVVYQRRDEIDPVELTQPIETFQRMARYKSDYGSEVDKKIEERGLPEL